MNILMIIVIGLIFCVFQFLILKNIKKAWIKWLPIGVISLGLLFCLVAYLNVFWTDSASVISENQYLALFLVVPLGSAFAGCLFGGTIYKLFCK